MREVIKRHLAIPRKEKCCARRPDAAKPRAKARQGAGKSK
jgi:hypothetical protein